MVGSLEQNHLCFQLMVGTKTFTPSVNGPNRENQTIYLSKSRSAKNERPKRLIAGVSGTKLFLLLTHDSEEF